MTDHLMDDLTEARKQVRLAPLLTLRDHEYAHERGICVDGCPFCEENRSANMSNQFDKPIEIDTNIGPFEGLDKIPWVPKETSGLVFTTLKDRSKYGDYGYMATVAQRVKEAMGARTHLSAVQRESLDMMATKIARIVCGDPNDPDHWLDIEGYAKLARDRIPVAPYQNPATP